MDPNHNTGALTEKRKRALLIYLSVLFFAAFFLVLFSFLIQLRDNRSTISELSQASTSALANAEKLQEENSMLYTQVNALQEQLLEEQRSSLETSAQLKDEIDTLNSTLKDLQSTAASTTEETKKRIDSLTEQLHAYQLLSRFLSATKEERETIKKELEPFLSLLDSQARASYDACIDSQDP